MKKLAFFLTGILVTLNAMGQQPYSGDIKKKNVVAVCDAVADWQIAHQSQVRHHPLDWTNGALYRGMMEWAKMTGEPKYYDFLIDIGKKQDWAMHRRTHHADDICVGQTFIELYRIYGDKAMLEPVLERARFVANNPSDAPLRKNDPVGKDMRWSWCDALFMAPPVYAALYTMTGDEKLLQYLDSEYKLCTDSLYDREAHLFYRDNMRIPLREPNGAKQFWGRGDGWVFGGLPLVIDNLPANHPSRAYYVELFKEMAPAILACQDAKGAWHASLLDPDSYPNPENSSSAFFTYGFAWGVRNGLLDAKVYKPAVTKGWASLCSAVATDGHLGYIQPVGADPRQAGIESTDVYGVGAFLLAGSEIYRMTGGKPVRINKK